MILLFRVSEQKALKMIMLHALFKCLQMCVETRQSVFNLLLHPVLVDAHDDLLARVDDGLTFGRALLDLQLRPAGSDSRRHATHGLNLNWKY